MDQQAAEQIATTNLEFWAAYLGLSDPIVITQTVYNPTTEAYNMKATIGGGNWRVRVAFAPNPPTTRPTSLVEVWNENS